jgi:hypothetical protein
MRLRGTLARDAYLRELRIPACQLRTLTIRAGAAVTLMTADADEPGVVTRGDAMVLCSLT